MSLKFWVSGKNTEIVEKYPTFSEAKISRQ